MKIYTFIILCFISIFSKITSGHIIQKDCGKKFSCIEEPVSCDLDAGQNSGRCTVISWKSDNAGVKLTISHKLESGVEDNWWAGTAIAFKKLMHDGDQS